MKNIQNQAAQRLREKGPLARGRESPTPLGQTGASFLSLGLPLLLVPNIAVRLNGVTIKLVQGSRYVFNLPTLYSCVIQWFEDIALLGICFFSLNVKACCVVNKEQNLVVIKEIFFSDNRLDVIKGS